MNFLRYFVAVPDFCRSQYAFWTNEFSILVAKIHFSANKKPMASVQGDNEINLTCLCLRKALLLLRVTVFVTLSIVEWCFQVVVNFLSLFSKCRSALLAVLDFFSQGSVDACVKMPAVLGCVQLVVCWFSPITYEWCPTDLWQVPAVERAGLRSCAGSGTDCLCHLK